MSDCLQAGAAAQLSCGVLWRWDSALRISLPWGRPISLSRCPSTPPADVLSLAQKVGLGATAGALAAIVGTPADVSLVRMQADNMAPPALRRNYTGVFNALGRIVKEEGVLSLWRGTAPTVVRAMVLNAALLSTADQMKVSCTHTAVCYWVAGT